MDSHISESIEVNSPLALTKSSVLPIKKTILRKRLDIDDPLQLMDGQTTITLGSPTSASSAMYRNFLSQLLEDVETESFSMSSGAINSSEASSYNFYDEILCDSGALSTSAAGPALRTASPSPMTTSSVMTATGTIVRARGNTSRTQKSSTLKLKTSSSHHEFYLKQSNSSGKLHTPPSDFKSRTALSSPSPLSASCNSISTIIQQLSSSGPLSPLTTSTPVNKNLQGVFLSSSTLVAARSTASFHSCKTSGNIISWDKSLLKSYAEISQFLYTHLNEYSRDSKPEMRVEITGNKFHFELDLSNFISQENMVSLQTATSSKAKSLTDDDDNLLLKTVIEDFIGCKSVAKKLVFKRNARWVTDALTTDLRLLIRSTGYTGPIDIQYRYDRNSSKISIANYACKAKSLTRDVVVKNIGSLTPITGAGSRNLSFIFHPLFASLQTKFSLDLQVTYGALQHELFLQKKRNDILEGVLNKTE